MSPSTPQRPAVRRPDRRPATLRRPALAGLVAVLVLGALAACAPVGTTDTTSTTDTATDAAIDSGSTATSEFDDDLQASVATVEHFWTGVFAQNGQTFTPVRSVLPYSESAPATCGGDALPLQNAVYCPTDDDISYDVAWTSDVYHQIGDSFVYYLIGHEYGHAAQRRLGLTSSLSIQTELQADCFAGAYLSSEMQAGNLQIEDGDVDELLSSLASVADAPDTPWFDPQAHGSARQRVTAFSTGYQQGLSNC